MPCVTAPPLSCTGWPRPARRTRSVRACIGLSCCLRCVGGVGSCAVDAVLDQWQVFGFHLDPNGLEAFDECGFDGGARSCERVEHGAAGWGDETDQPTHDFQGLDSTVLYPVHVRTLRLRGLRRVEKPGRAARSAVADIGCALAVRVVGVD